MNQHFALLNLSKLVIPFCIILQLNAQNAGTHEEEYTPIDLVFSADYPKNEYLDTNLQFSSLTQILSNFPDFPTPEQLISPENKQIADKKVYRPFILALENMLPEITQEVLALDTQMDEARKNILLLQTDNNTTIPPQQEKSPTDKNKRNDLENNRLTEINNELHENLEKLMSFSQKYQNLSDKITSENNENEDNPYQYNNGIVNTDFFQLYSDLYANWINSEEYKKIIQIDKNLQKKIDAWLETQPKNANDSIAFPEWFVTDRKIINSLSLQWTNRVVSQWTKLANNNLSQIRNILTAIAPLERENAEIGASGLNNDLTYLANKQQLATIKSQLSILITLISDIFQFPNIEPIQETGYYYFGKG